MATDTLSTLGYVRELSRPKSRFVAWIAVLAGLGGFLFGFDTGVVGSAAPYLSAALHIGSFGKSWVVGSLLLGAIGGAVISGYLAEAISRKWTKFASGVVFTVAALGCAFVPDVEWLCVARFVLGLAVGTASFVAPMYISEQSPKRMRGGMTALNQVMVTFGILVAFLTDYALSGLHDGWRWMFGIEAVPGALLAVAMIFVPHTPRWLLERERMEDAKSVLRRTRPDDDVDQEAGEIEEVASQQSRSGLRELFGPRLRPALIVGLTLAFLQQAVGINAVIYFGATVLKFMGHSTNTAVYEAVSLGIVNFVFAVIAVLLLDWVGRKVLLLVGSTGMAASLGALGWYFSTAPSFQHSEAVVGLGCILAFLAFFELSLGPVFWLMISELYPLRIRSKAMAASTMVNWTFNFLVSYFFLTMTADIGRDGTFWLFGSFAVCAAAFTVLKVPETRGRSLEEIEHDLGVDEGAAGRAA